MKVSESVRMSNEIKAGLKQLPEKCTILFKRIYSYGHPDMEIDLVVDYMDIEKLPHALRQVNRSLEIER